MKTGAIMVSDRKESDTMGLRQLREAAGLSQSQLVKLSGIAKSRISDTETGRRPIGRMSLENAIKLADALKVEDLRDLLA